MLLLDTFSSLNLSSQLNYNKCQENENLSIRFSIFLSFLFIYFFVFFTIHKFNSQHWFGSNVHYAAFIVPQQSSRTVLFTFVIRFSTQFLFSAFVVHFLVRARSSLIPYSLLQLCTQFNTQHIVEHSMASIERNFNHFHCKLSAASIIRTRNEWYSMEIANNWEIENQNSKHFDNNINNEAKWEPLPVEELFYEINFSDFWLWIGGVDTIPVSHNYQVEIAFQLT